MQIVNHLCVILTYTSHASVVVDVAASQCLLVDVRLRKT